jgi:MFS superfamily sulfate permease-like transporter
MNIPQAMGYAKIAGMPVITGLYTLLLPLVAFAAFGSSRYLVVASDSATAAILAGGLADLATAGSAPYVSLAGLAITRIDYTAGGAVKELHENLARQGVTLVLVHLNQSLKADLDRQGLTEVIGRNRQFETPRECLAAYEASTRRSSKESVSGT